MARKFSELTRDMPATRKKKIARRSRELEREDLEYRRLQEIRQAMATTQVELAGQLRIKQAAVSKLESQSDMYVSTLRRIITALGGELHITASFPDGTQYEISPFAGDARPPAASE